MLYSASKRTSWWRGQKDAVDCVEKGGRKSWAGVRRRRTPAVSGRHDARDRVPPVPTRSASCAMHRAPDVPWSGYVYAESSLHSHCSLHVFRGVNERCVEAALTSFTTLPPHLDKTLSRHVVPDSLYNSDMESRRDGFLLRTFTTTSPSLRSVLRTTPLPGHHPLTSMPCQCASPRCM